MKQSLLALMGIGCLGLTACVDTTEPDQDPETTAEARHGHHGHHNPPDPADEAFASDVADAMIDRIVALLFREFAVTTADNAAVGTVAISNVFHNGNPTMRLVGDQEPLQHSNFPNDDFEDDALAQAKLGLGFSRTERIHGDWFVRKSIAVSTDFSPACVHCHPNFATVTNHWVGALMVMAEVDD